MTWYASVDGEWYDAGPYRTIEEALRLAPSDLGLETAARFWAAKRAVWKPKIEVEPILERLNDLAFEASADGDDFLARVPIELQRTLQLRLQREFDAWLEETGLKRPLFEMLEQRFCVVDHEGFGHELR